MYFFHLVLKICTIDSIASKHKQSKKKMKQVYKYIKVRKITSHLRNNKQINAYTYKYLFPLDINTLYYSINPQTPFLKIPTDKKKSYR